MIPELTYEFIKSLPKAELHCHLDGSIRIDTIIKYAKKYGVTLPVDGRENLEKYLHASENTTSLTDYLKAFDVTCSVLQWEETLEEVTYELAEDCAAENVRYLEIRFSPILHLNKGMKMTSVVESVLHGKERAEKAFDIKIGIIICGLRHMNPDISILLAELCLAYKTEV